MVMAFMPLMTFMVFMPLMTFMAFMAFVIFSHPVTVFGMDEGKPAQPQSGHGHCRNQKLRKLHNINP